MRNYRPMLDEFSFKGRQIPEYMRPGLAAYLESGIPPGSFLAAVLSNDLRQAVYNADEQNVSVIHVYVSFLYNHAPTAAWGSAERVDEWIEQKEVERTTQCE